MRTNEMQLLEALDIIERALGTEVPKDDEEMVYLAFETLIDAVREMARIRKEI
jgi:hypothetical protein